MEKQDKTFPFVHQNNPEWIAQNANQIPLSQETGFSYSTSAAS